VRLLVVLVSLVAAASSSAQAPAARAIGRVPLVSALEIRGQRVWLRSEGNADIERTNAAGDEVIDDRFHIVSETGDVVPTPGARPANEISLERNEGCRIGHDPSIRIVLVRIEGRRAVLRLNGWDRGGRDYRYLASVAPY
jgi:hypothetical protein